VLDILRSFFKVILVNAGVAKVRIERLDVFSAEARSRGVDVAIMKIEPWLNSKQRAHVARLDQECRRLLHVSTCYGLDDDQVWLEKKSSPFQLAIYVLAKSHGS
jgi:hypothetical protein